MYMSIYWHTSVCYACPARKMPVRLNTLSNNSFKHLRECNIIIMRIIVYKIYFRKSHWHLLFRKKKTWHIIDVKTYIIVEHGLPVVEFRNFSKNDVALAFIALFSYYLCTSRYSFPVMFLAYVVFCLLSEKRWCLMYLHVVPEILGLKWESQLEGTARSDNELFIVLSIK